MMIAQMKETLFHIIDFNIYFYFNKLKNIVLATHKIYYPHRLSKADN